ncbi:universal stress protein [Natrialbaceae archaeon GCM10025810]|uniref:universal stress protein n=1 Tax=Halovalidus salilacus TaxID=3075124 RepID=UPI003614C250
MYQNVLIPTDGSDETRRAIAHGLAIADRFDATVHALSVVPEGPYGPLDDEGASEVARRAVEIIEIDADREGVDVTTAVERGVPHEEILSYADEEDVDMIVMGTKGRTGVDRVLVGSVAERVVRLSPVPVVTVRLEEDVELTDPEEAERIARRALEDDDYDDVTVLEEPHRTSGSWIVPAETDEGLVHVHVDAVTGETRIARRRS